MAALSSLNRNNGWQIGATSTLATNLDAQNHSAALAKFITDKTLPSTAPIFFLGFANGADASILYANFLATATPARNVKGAILYASSGNDTLTAVSKVPQYFALSENDENLGAAGLAAARTNSQELAGRGIATGLITNAISPLVPARLGAIGVTTPAFTLADATAVVTAVKTAGLIDSNNYVKAVPTTAALTTALPAAYSARVPEIASAMAVAYGAQEFYSDANARVVAFLAARVAGTAAPAPGRLANLSTRTKITFIGDSITLGFNIGGSTDKATLLIRGVGPALLKFGVANAIAALHLEVRDGASKLIASNDRWDAPGGTATAAQIASAAAGVGAFALAPGDLDTAVLLPNLSPGSYTATISGVNGAVGDVLAEVYDVTKNNTRLTTLSTLGKIANDGDLLIPGIVVQGTSPRTLLVRAVGPGLTDFGLPANAILTDPRISVLNSTGATVDTNNNWFTGTAANPSAATTTLIAVFPAVGAFPLKQANAADAAVISVINAGNYTLQAGAAPQPPNQAANAAVNLTGSVLVEVYEVP